MKMEIQRLKQLETELVVQLQQASQSLVLTVSKQH